MDDLRARLRHFLNESSSFGSNLFHGSIVVLILMSITTIAKDKVQKVKEFSEAYSGGIHYTKLKPL